MHGTPYDSRAKVVLVALRAVKEYFDCAIDLPAFLTIEKSHVQNTSTYFSGTELNCGFLTFQYTDRGQYIWG